MTVVDATLGGAGHAREIAARLGPDGTLIGFDADPAAIERAEAALSDAGPSLTLINANFRRMREELQGRGITAIDGALFDLGWSSYQLESGRGFSFRSDEPLEMTYGPGQALTASTIVNTWEEESIAEIIYGWGEDRFARRIAHAICVARDEAPIEHARQLAEIVKAAVPPQARYGRIHPATKTFQALRIAVNDEMGATEEGVRAAWEMLREGGRIAVITFHSVEDRHVKNLFKSLAAEGAEIATKRPIVPTDDEIASNPRARSAKLRVIARPTQHHA